MRTRRYHHIGVVTLCLLLAACTSVPRTLPVDIRFTVAKPSPELTVSSVKARATRHTVVFTFEYQSTQNRKLYLFNPPDGGVFGHFVSAPANHGIASVTVSKVNLRQVSAIIANIFPVEGDGDYFIFLNFADITPLLGEGVLVAQSIQPKPSLPSEEPQRSEPLGPPVDIRYEATPASDLAVSSVTAEATTDSIVFTFGYKSSDDRTLYIFDPPNGVVFKQSTRAPANQESVRVTVSKIHLRQVSAVTANFSLDSSRENSFIFLNFADITLLLGESMASAQVSRQPNETQYKTLLSAPGKLEIVRMPAPGGTRGKLSALPAYNPSSNELWQVDVRSYDLSGLDLSGRLADLLHADFDSKTSWPKKLPSGFDPSSIMALGRNPGLGIRALHAKGLTGKGVGIAIIDQALLVDHSEYKARLRMYEEIHWMAYEAQMHAPAVASIAVGKTVGVAPEADLYFIAEWHAKANPSGGWDYVLAPLAQSIDRIVAVNKMLPAASRIRVISISLGINPSMGDYELVARSIDAAAKDGIYVVYVGSDRYSGMGRDPLADPDSFESWKAGHYWAGSRVAADVIMIPMDARCTASPTGTSDYVFYSEGGMSWTVPWVAGLFAIACQVKPSVTREEFWATAAATAVINKAGFGKIINPEGLITALQGRI